MCPINPFYKLGRDDAHDNRYPLYSALVVGGQMADAREYARGWLAITGCQLATWRDRSAPV